MAELDAYDWPGGREAMLRFGPDGAPTVLLTLPLLDEANRTRAFANGVLRALAERGIAGVLPELPGAGESLVPTAAATLTAMRRAHAALTRRLGDRVYAASIRSGALIDAASPVAARWHLAPATGADVIRDLLRLDGAGGGLYDRDLLLAETKPVSIAGSSLSPALIAEIAAATPAQARVVRLESDPRPADRKLDGSPLWRRAEPGDDPAFAVAVADDIAGWIAACDG